MIRKAFLVVIVTIDIKIRKSGTGSWEKVILQFLLVVIISRICTRLTIQQQRQNVNGVSTRDGIELY